MPVGKLGPFDLVNDNWELYVDRLEQYFVANDVKSEVKVATLITVMGGDAYELMVNLCTPAKPATKTYDQLVALMKGHLNPKPSLLAERFKFRQRVQKRDENIANFVTDLKKLSKDCSFTGDNSLKENLRDQFVCGLLNDDIRQKLFTEDDTITFDRAYKLAVSMEAAEVNAALVEDCARNRTSDSIPASATTSVHHVGRAGRGRAAADGGRPAAGTTARGKITSGGGGLSAMSGAGSGKMRGFGQNNNADFNGVCKVCGAKHEADRCKFKKYVCRVCNQEGHLKRVCPKLRGSSSVYNVTEEKVVYLDRSDNSDSDEGLGRFTGGTVGFHLRPDARPVFLRARPLAYALREPVERALEQMVRDGIITPVATSDWATPIVPVVKKDGTIRIFL
ncbi:uncharacterized protein LOC134791562 [Cydia splendana]|uniref:uncharacterized protein LOC134791562 n=1 Tax=Cydia splendana TaxID=1100963 RepID=UPI00300C8A71